MPVNLFHTIILGLIICYSIAIPINREDKSSFIRNGQYSIQADQIIGIRKRSMKSSLNITKEGELRQKRDNVGTMDIKAIQTTINDHKTMIEDNRVMIFNIINSSINTNNIKEAVTSHYTNAPPMWSSWRDSALVFVTTVIMIQVISFCAFYVKLKPCDLIISRILKRYDTRQSTKGRPLFSPLAMDNGANLEHAQKRQHLAKNQQASMRNIEQDYADIQHNRGPTI